MFSRPFTKKTSNANFGCKIILAEMNKTRKGVTFSESNQTFITVQEETANVPYITEKVKEKFGKDMVLVSGNGLPVTDEEGTRGSKFWKVSSRKIYAVKTSSPAMLPKQIKKKRAISESSSDSDEAEKPKKKYSSLQKMLTSIDNSINNLNEDVVSVASSLETSLSMLKELTVVSSALPLPPKVIKLVNDAFKCKICLKLPMRPPVIGTRCCSTILGCTDCVNNWYSGEEGLNKTCPNCREPQGYAQTFKFKGIDEFLEGFKKILSEEST